MQERCPHQALRSQPLAHVGFDALGRLDDPSRRAQANYCYGQVEVVRELQELVGGCERSRSCHPGSEGPHRPHHPLMPHLPPIHPPCRVVRRFRYLSL